MVFLCKSYKSVHFKIDALKFGLDMTLVVAVGNIKWMSRFTAVEGKSKSSAVVEGGILMFKRSLVKE